MNLKKKKKENPEFPTPMEEPADNQNKKKKLPGWVILPVLGGLFLIFGAISLITGGSDDSSAGLALKTVTAEKGNVKEVFNSSGTIESENTKTYYSPVTAPVKEYNVAAGQPVKAGDLLVSFDTTTLERDNQQAQLTLQSSLNNSLSAKAQNARAVNAANAVSAQAAEKANALAAEVNDLADRTDEAWQKYQENLTAVSSEAQANAALREQLQTQISEKEAIVTANQTIIDNINSGYAGRRADLEAALLIPESERTGEQQALIDALKPVFEKYDAAVSARDQAQADIDEANAALSRIQDPQADDAGYAELKAQYDAKYAEWQAAYQAAQTTTEDTGMNSYDLENLQISDNLAELAAMTPGELLEKGREGIRADMNGVIASADLVQSNSAVQGSALFTIASTDEVCVKIQISPDDYSKMKEGNDVTVTLSGNTYQGTLKSIDRIALKNEKGTPVIGAVVHINNPDETICIGATAKIKMTVAESKNVIVIPTEAINASSDGDFVYVIENGTVEIRNVETGTSSGTETEICSGLKEGDIVVNDLNVDITPGMKAVAKGSDSE